MPTAAPFSHFTRRRLAAFALLVVVTLLAFLVVLLVGLASVTRVETSVASNTQRQAQAREHALLALNLAVAHLQKYAGPDQRVTATADALSKTNAHYTGVWNSTTTDMTPLTWLVSGNEIFQSDGTNDPLARKPTSTLTTTSGANPTGAELVGKNSSGIANDVVAPLVPITAAGIPGTAASATPTIGRYAWWVGDQGVKAPVAIRDATATANNYDYAPFSSSELRSRIRQQVSLGAGAATSAGAAIFEPRDTSGNPSNATLAGNTTAMQQIAFLRTGTTTVGTAALQQNFHAWSPNNFGVLASTNPLATGLRRDLSLKPEILGDAFAAWANYSSATGGYMEDPSAPLAAAPLPGYSSDPVRRRYRITPPKVDRGFVHSVAPVLSFFGISFSLHNDTLTNSPTKLIASVRCVVGLWNPYTSALVPEDLKITVAGLPTVVVASGTVARTVDLQTTFLSSDGTVTFALPFTPDNQNADRSSWLPGRVYNWSALSSSGDPGSSGYGTEFYRRDAEINGSGVERDAGLPIGPNTISGVQQDRSCAVTADQTLVITLKRASDDQELARFTSPTFEAFATDDSTRAPGALSSDFAYVFRLPNAQEIPEAESAAWLEAPGRDPRENIFPAAGQQGYVVADGQPPQPPLLVIKSHSGFHTSFSQLVLDRPASDAARNYNEDVPVFELPRTPLLSLGSLQHLHIAGARPFAFGNSWGGTLNRAFDQYFFSGLTSATDWNDVAKPLPNPLLLLARHKPDGAPIASDDVKDANGYSGKFLLQGGAFNLNSVNRAAWIAVLRSVRFPAVTNFRYHDVAASTGTGDDSTTTLADPLLANSRVAAFARFGQSAQETFKADDGYAQSDSSQGTGNIVNTPLFRRGIRFLSEQDVANLADKIVTLMEARLSAIGPFRSLEEFLTPSPTLVGSAGAPVSLLEKAIENAGLNTDAALGLTDTSIEFSSQWLTQADIMTALAPVLFARSDTFVVRAYGEAVNPITNATEGRAWCEATVQRVPEYFNAAADDAAASPDALTDPQNLNQTLGRRFKIVSFRWLTRSDI